LKNDQKIKINQNHQQQLIQSSLESQNSKEKLDNMLEEENKGKISQNYKQEEKAKKGNLISFSFETVRSLSKIKAFKAKTKMCLQVFRAFKKHENYKAFKKFTKIENKICLNEYDKLSKMAKETRTTFNEYFGSFAAEACLYPKLFGLLSHFENCYREFENKNFIRETKNFLEIKKKMNKLQKIVKTSKNSVAASNLDKSNGNQRRISHLASSGACEKNSFLRFNNKQERKVSNEFKLELLNNIKGLKSEQIRGMVCLVMETKEAPSASCFELDINKLSTPKVKELDKYVRKCLLELKEKEFPKEFYEEKDLLNKDNCVTNQSYSDDNYAVYKQNYTNNGNNNNIDNKDGFYYAGEKFNHVEGRDNYNNYYNAAYSINEEANCFLGRKQKASFFANTINCNNIGNFNSKSLFSNSFIIQTSCTNPETPVSKSNKLNKISGIKNSLMMEFDSESEESSEEESYSDLQIGNFKI